MSALLPVSLEQQGSRTEGRSLPCVDESVARGPVFMQSVAGGCRAEGRSLLCVDESVARDPVTPGEPGRGPLPALC